MIREFITFDCPTYAPCYMEYGDPSGLEEEDIQNIDKFLASMPKGSMFNYGEEEYFSVTPAFGLPCTCIKTTAYYEDEVRL